MEMKEWKTFKERPLTEDDVGKFAFVLYAGEHVLVGRVLSDPRKNHEEYFITDGYSFPLATHYALIGYSPPPIDFQDEGFKEKLADPDYVSGFAKRLIENARFNSRR